MSGQGEKPTRVLLIDDDPELSASVKIALELEGYAVSVASSGIQGVEMAAMSPPDIIVLDVEMPVMAGPETLKELRCRSHLDDTKVIFLTGKVDLDALEETFEGEAQGYLLKPFSTVQLLDRIEELLGPQGPDE